MTAAPRTYCLADKPIPVSARALAYLARMDGIIWAWWEIREAPRIYERLRLGGYVRFDQHRLYAQITNAGHALLHAATSVANPVAVAAGEGAG